jgi:hypothetical protein
MYLTSEYAAGAAIRKVLTSVAMMATTVLSINQGILPIAVWLVACATTEGWKKLAGSTLEGKKTGGYVNISLSNLREVTSVQYRGKR